MKKYFFVTLVFALLMTAVWFADDLYVNKKAVRLKHKIEKKIDDAFGDYDVLAQISYHDKDVSVEHQDPYIPLQGNRYENDIDIRNRILRFSNVDHLYYFIDNGSKPYDYERNGKYTGFQLRIIEKSPYDVGFRQSFIYPYKLGFQREVDHDYIQKVLSESYKYLTENPHSPLYYDDKDNLYSTKYRIDTTHTVKKIRIINEDEELDAFDFYDEYYDLTCYDRVGVLVGNRYGDISFCHRIDSSNRAEYQYKCEGDSLFNNLWVKHYNYHPVEGNLNDTIEAWNSYLHSIIPQKYYYTYHFSYSSSNPEGKGNWHDVDFHTSDHYYGKITRSDVNNRPYSDKSFYELDEHQQKNLLAWDKAFPYYEVYLWRSESENFLYNYKMWNPREKDKERFRIKSVIAISGLYLVTIITLVIIFRIRKKRRKSNE